jgi:hypothetical protein
MARIGGLDVRIFLFAFYHFALRRDRLEENRKSLLSRLRRQFRRHRLVGERAEHGQEHHRQGDTGDAREGAVDQRVDQRQPDHPEDDPQHVRQGAHHDPGPRSSGHDAGRVVNPTTANPFELMVRVGSNSTNGVSQRLTLSGNTNAPEYSFLAPKVMP